MMEIHKELKETNKHLKSIARDIGCFTLLFIMVCTFLFLIWLDK